MRRRHNRTLGRTGHVYRALIYSWPARILAAAGCWINAEQINELGVFDDLMPLEPGPEARETAP